MSKKRGLSLEEKRSRLLEVFHDSEDVFVLKEVEKLGVKKGITPQTVKDVLMSLVDDDLVHQEKIGASNYFWAFPSEEIVKLENEQRACEQSLASLNSRIKTAQAQASTSVLGKENSQERENAMALLQELQTKEKDLEQQVREFKENDPQAVDKMREACGVAVDAANRWLDNIYSLEAWCKKQFQGREDEVKKFFAENGMVEDMEYLE